MQEASEFGERCDMKIDCLSDERQANRGKCTRPREGAQSIDADVVLVADPTRKFRQGHRALGLVQMHYRLGEQRNAAQPCWSGSDTFDAELRLHQFIGATGALANKPRVGDAGLCAIGITQVRYGCRPMTLRPIPLTWPTTWEPTNWVP